MLIQGMGLCRKGLFVKATSVIALGCHSNSTKTPNLASLHQKSSHCGSCLSLNDVVLHVVFCALKVILCFIRPGFHAAQNAFKWSCRDALSTYMTQAQTPTGNWPAETGELDTATVLCAEPHSCLVLISTRTIP